MLFLYNKRIRMHICLCIWFVVCIYSNIVKLVPIPKYLEYIVYLLLPSTYTYVPIAGTYDREMLYRFEDRA